MFWCNKTIMMVHGVYTAEDLVREALELGFSPVSKRLIYDWSALGLLDYPTLYSSGRRGRSNGFPESQHRLFLTLLEQRKSKGSTKEILGLCNAPVFVWLWWDDYIALSQVRRALKTWGQACLAESVTGAQRAAVRVLNQLNLPRYARGRKALKLAIETVIIEIAAGRSPDDVNWNEIGSRLTRIWNEDKTGRPRGPAGAQTTPQLIVTLLRQRYRSIVNLDKFEDFEFHWARWVYRMTSRDYHNRSHEFARDPELGHLHQNVSTAEYIANHACVDLLTTLGTAYLSHREGTLWDPATWKQYHLESTTTGEVKTTGGVIVPLRR